MYKATYINNEGKYQKEMEQLFSLLIPKVGIPNTSLGKLVRSVNQTYYDIFNNGGANWSALRNDVNRINAWIRKNMSKAKKDECWNIASVAPTWAVKTDEQVLDIIIDSILEWILNKDEKEAKEEEE